MVPKILIGSLVVLVMAVLGTVGVVYVQSECSIAEFRPTGPSDQSSCSQPPISCCPCDAMAAPSEATVEEAKPSCCKEPARGEVK